MPQKFLAHVVYLLVPMLIIGCGGETVKVPKFNPSAIAKAAMEDYDLNKDGFIDQEELKKAPSLKDAESVIDTNKDGKLDQEEISERIAFHLKAGLGLMSFSCNVSRFGQPLADADVVLEPEKFMGELLKPCRGKTDPLGVVNFKAEGNADFGTPPGFYKIKVTAQGSPTIPKKFNEETILGKEIAADRLGRGGDSFKIQITAK